MLLVILLTNVPIIKRKEMNNMIQIENKRIKEKEPKIKFSTKAFAQKKTTPHQMMMKTVKER
jgi:phage antirepressor YoqD-like protein